jgi:hypothetical protein
MKSEFLSFGLAFAQEYDWPFAEQLTSISPNKVLLYETMAHLDGDYAGDSYAAMQQRVISGYQALQQHLGSKSAIVPVGEVWLRAYTDLTARGLSPGAILYSDDVHPSVEGTYLVACSFFTAIFNATTAGIRKPPKGVSVSFAALASQWADDVILGRA